MAWTAPLTWTPNSALTAAQLNTHLRDNMLETEAAKATGGGGYMVATGTNAITERQPGHAEVVTSETTTSTTYTNLATVGPSVTLNVGPQALAIWAVQYQSNTAGQSAMCSIDVSGANTIAANDQFACNTQRQANYPIQHMHHLWYTGLASGSTTFTLKYRAPGGNTCTFARRRLVVLPY